MSRWWLLIEQAELEKIMNIPSMNLTDEEYKKLSEYLKWPDKFPVDEAAVSGLGGKIYQWLKNEHFKRKKKWTKSDVFFYKGGCFVVPIWIGYILFAAIFGWMFLKTFENYGLGKLIVLVSIFLLWRVNVMISVLMDISKRLK